MGVTRSELLLHLWNFGHFMRKAAEDAYSQGNHQWRDLLRPISSPKLHRAKQHPVTSFDRESHTA